jgi:hypothetical protein
MFCLGIQDSFPGLEESCLGNFTAEDAEIAEVMVRPRSDGGDEPAKQASFLRIS